MSNERKIEGQPIHALPMPPYGSSHSTVSQEALASAHRVSDKYRINLSESELRAWAQDAVKVIRVLAERL